MLKAIAFLLIGALPAAVVTWKFVDRETPKDVSSIRESADAAAAIDREPTTRANGAVNTLAAAYQAASEISDPAVLETELGRAMAEPFSVERTARVEALFTRLAGIDLRRALRMAQVPGFDRKLLARVFQAWAQNDPDAALEQLTAVYDPATRIELAVALLDGLGNDAQGIARIAARLPEAQRIDFQAEALARRAESDATGALSAALRLGDPSARNTAVQRIGIALTQLDPIGAIARAEALPPELQAAYRDSVAVEWARLDVSGFLAYADGQPTLGALRAGLFQAMAVDPKGLFETTTRHAPVPVGPPFGPAITVERTAFSNVVLQDPEWAMAYLETITDVQRRNGLRLAMAESLGRTNPEEALEWARRYAPEDIGLLAQVVWSAGYREIDLAVDWMLDFEDMTGQPAPPIIPSTLAMYASSSPRRNEVMNRLRALDDDPVAADLLRRTAILWMQVDPESALDWVLEDGPSADPVLVTNIAGRLAGRNPELAASYVERLPPELKGIWLEQIAGPYALQDPDAAASWIEQFRNEPSYETVVQRVVQMSAQTDPAGAGRMLQVAPENVQTSTSASVASAWVQQDLAGAARWAVGLASSGARSNAVRTVASAWAIRDPETAQRWALGLPRGEMRDQALASLVSLFSRPDFAVPIESRLIEAIDSDELRRAAEQML